jgi:tRNA-binding EMAP/Myf-like protein
MSWLTGSSGMIKELVNSFRSSQSIKILRRRHTRLRKLWQVVYIFFFSIAISLDFEASKAPAKSVGKAPAAAQKKSGDEEASPSLLDIRVGEVIDVEPHPSSDTLYVEKINVGEPQPRQIVRSLLF